MFLFALVVSFSCAFDYGAINGSKVPNELKTLVGTQRINVFLDDEFYFSAEIKDGKLYSSDIEVKKATLEAYFLNSTLERIEASNDKFGETLEAYKAGEIRIVKKTFMNKLRFFFAKFFI